MAKRSVKSSREYVAKVTFRDGDRVYKPGDTFPPDSPKLSKLMSPAWSYVCSATDWDARNPPTRAERLADDGLPAPGDEPVAPEVGGGD